MSGNKDILQFSDGEPNGQTLCYIEVTRGTSKTEFFKHFEYLYSSSGNVDELGFSLANWMTIYSGFVLIYATSGADITDIKVYTAIPVAFPLELTELQLATQTTAGLVKVGSEWNNDGDIFGLTNITMHLPEGKIEAPKPWVQVPSFEYSESGGMVPDNVAPAYARNGFVVESSNYLAEILGIEATDFPIQIVGASMVYGSGLPYVPCQFFTKTGKSGYFNWRVNGKAENAVLNATGGDSDIFVVRFTQNDNTWSADKTYAEIKQAIDDGKVVQGVVYNNFIGIGILHGGIVMFQFNASSFDPDSGIYGLKALVIIVKADGIIVRDSLDEPWGEYHDAILPSQVLLVINAGGNISAKLSALGERGSPLTYLISYNALNTFPVLTALYLAPNVAPERFYFSNVVKTPDSATSSTKVDFVFKSADATKTLTGSVTKPNDWDGETPLAETWTYIEADPLDGAVRYDKTQSLTDAQKQQARDNIGVVDVPTPSAENVGKIPVSKQVGDGYKYVMEDKSTSDLSLGITGATPGQIAKITAVDTNGKPTAWEPVDMAGGGEREWEVIADIITTSEDVLYYRYDVPDKKELIVLVSLTPLADSTSPVNGTIAINGTGNPWNGSNYTYISGNILSVKSSERGMSIVLSGEIIDRKWVPKSLFGSLNRGASWNALQPDGTMPLTSDDTTNACSFTSVDAIRSVAVGSYTKWFGVGSHIYILAR